MKEADNEGIIEFSFHKSIKRFPFSEEEVRKWIFLCIEQELESGVCGYLNFIFCSDKYLHAINVKYLNHDTYTDIITFDYTSDYNSVSGDMFISVDRVKENAKLHNVSFDHELYRVIIHGFLHLVGYDDKTEDDEFKMRFKENFYLSMANFV